MMRHGFPPLKATGTPTLTAAYWPAEVAALAAALRAGEDCWFALSDALLECGRPDLAELLGSERGTKRALRVILDTIKTRWCKRDGEVIRVCDMDDGHLLNTIRMLGGFNRALYRKELRSMKDEALKRGLAL